MRFSFRKILTLSSVALLLTLFFFLGKSSVTQAKPTIPERNGVYNDPDHPGVKVRVFVHPAKNNNPGNGHGHKTPTPTPTDTPFPTPTPTSSSSPAPTSTPTPAPLCQPTDDPSSSALDGLTGWSLDPDWTYNLNVDSAPSSVGSTNLPQIASLAFAQWNAPTGVTFHRGANTSVSRQAYDGVNTIAWGHTSGSALAVTYTRYYTSTGQVVDVDTIFNSNFPWVWSNQPNCAIPNAYDAQDILTHETGHWMGLDDEYDSNHQNNTMYGYGATGEVKKDTLTAGDYNAAYNLYH